MFAVARRDRVAKPLDSLTLELSIHRRLDLAGEVIS